VAGRITGPIRPDMIKKKLINNFQCQKFYTEEIGEGISRKVFDSLIDELAPGDVVVFTTLKVLPLTTLKLINQVNHIYKKGSQSLMLAAFLF
jgi:S-adenosylmethionine:tRNA-ribosyltransferase-isomerase (queuine synthetase)